MDFAVPEESVFIEPDQVEFFSGQHEELKGLLEKQKLIVDHTSVSEETSVDTGESEF